MNKVDTNFDPISIFTKECKEEINKQSQDHLFLELSQNWMNQSWKHKYTYHFNWLGRPIIQMPQDILALQEIIWNIKPDLIIETGIAHGGSLCLTASLLALLELEEMKNNSISQDKIIKRKVIGIDIDIRKHNREHIEKHFLSDKIEMIESSSVNKDTFNKVKSLSKDYSNILVMLDSNHTESHVLEELTLYSSLISKNSYCIVFDTIVEKMDSEFSKNRPWNKKNSPQSAIKKFLKRNDNFIVDKTIDKKIILSMAPGGFLKKIK